MPRVLTVMANSESARAEFAGGWRSVPPKALLPWAAQMMSLLDTPQGPTLIPPLEASSISHLPELTRLNRKSWKWCENAFCEFEMVVEWAL